MQLHNGRILLNIGLNKSTGGATLGSAFVLGVLEGLEMKPDIMTAVTHLPPRESMMEATLVVEVSIWDIKNRLAKACRLLNQDCIAAYVPGQLFLSELVGPKAKQWGIFDPAKFILLDGTRLGDKHSLAKAS